MAYIKQFPLTIVPLGTNKWDGFTKLTAEDQAIYDIVNAILAANGHAHTGNGSDGALIKFLYGLTANLKPFGNPEGTALEWGTGFKIGTFTRDTSIASGTQAITGIGFKPSHIIFLSSTAGSLPSGAEVSIGFDNGTQRFSIFNFHNATANTWSYDTPPICLYQSASISYTGSIVTLDVSGFTINWTKIGLKTGTTTISYLAFR